MNFRRTTGSDRNRGQALLLAVILLVIMALLGAAMIAVVSAGLDETGRDEQKLRSRLLAEAGIRFADEMLTASADGADWRPSLPANLDPRSGSLDQPTYDLTWDSYEMLRGWDPQHIAQQYAATETPVYFVKYRFHMEPDALSTSTETPVDDPSQDFVDPAVPITPIENVEETAPHDHFLLRIEYAPDPAEPLSKHLKITSVGRPGDAPTSFTELVAYKPLGIQDYLLFVHDQSQEGGLGTLGQPAVDLNGDGVTNSNRGDHSALWAAAGDNDFIPLRLDGPVRSNIDLQLLAPARLDPLEPGGGWVEKVEVAGSLSQVVDAAIDPLAPGGNAEVLLVNDDGSTAMYANENTPPATKVQATTPDTDAAQPWPTQLEVGLERMIQGPSLEVYEPATGISRWDRLTRYSGTDISRSYDGGTTTVYENSGEYGYGRGIYVDNGSQRDLLATAQNAWLQPETWGGRRFVPNGCIIELFAHYPNPLDDTLPPAIAITRTDGSTWLEPTATNPQSSGKRTMVFDWPDKEPGTTWGFTGTVGPRPENGIIVCEGNVRILGRLPQSDVDANLDYNLTVVSRGSIFVEGPLLRPSDYLDGLAEDDPENTRLALLARDNLVLNPTALAPGLVPGMPPGPFTVPRDAPDDAFWTLDPNGTEAIGLRVPICKDPYGNVYGNRRVMVIEADGNPNDGLRARAAVTLAKTRATLGLEPDPAQATATQPMLLWNSSPGLPGYVPDPPAGALSAIGAFAFFSDWRNLASDEYNTAGGTMEYFPDNGGVAITNWNSDVATGELGVPSYVTVQGGTDWDDTSFDSRSDVIVKNLKVERLTDSSDPLKPRPGIDFVVSALMFAERGSFYVIPGDWFDPRADSPASVWATSSANTDTDADLAAAKYARLRRYNYRITINGAIAVNRLPSVMEVAEWVDKWAYPPDHRVDSDGAPTVNALSGAGLFNDYGSINYRYDWGLRGSALRPNLPRLPALPASPDLIYWGQER